MTSIAPGFDSDSTSSPSRDTGEALVDLEFSDLHIGREASFDVLVGPDSLDAFAALSGDVSPIHMSREAAEARGFTDRVGHGMLAGAFISRLIGTRLPGSRVLLQTVNLKFHHPFHPGELLNVHGVVREAHESVRVVVIDVRITCDGKLIVSAKVQAGVAS